MYRYVEYHIIYICTQKYHTIRGKLQPSAPAQVNACRLLRVQARAVINELKNQDKEMNES